MNIMKQERIKKGQEIAKEIIGRYIVEELDDASIEYGIITVTEVIISPDLSYLDAYVSSLKNGDSLTKYLAKSARNIEKRICKSFPIVKIPRIRFRYDNHGKDSFEIHQKIKDLPLKDE